MSMSLPSLKAYRISFVAWSEEKSPPGREFALGLMAPVPELKRLLACRAS